MKRSRFHIARKWLIFWTLLVGIGAVWGAACMMTDPTGKLLQMDAMKQDIFEHKSKIYDISFEIL